MFIWIFYVLTYFYFAGTVRADQSQNDDNVARIESAAATEKRGRCQAIKCYFRTSASIIVEMFHNTKYSFTNVESYEHEFSIQPSI